MNAIREGEEEIKNIWKYGVSNRGNPRPEHPMQNRDRDDIDAGIVQVYLHLREDAEIQRKRANDSKTTARRLIEADNANRAKINAFNKEQMELHAAEKPFQQQRNHERSAAFAYVNTITRAVERLLGRDAVIIWAGQQSYQYTKQGSPVYIGGQPGKRYELYPRFVHT